MTRRILAPLCMAVAAMVAVSSTALAAAAPAPPTNLGPVLVTPASGDDSTLFNGKVAANCPADTLEGSFAAVGPGSDFLTNGEGYLGLADETTFRDGDLTWFLYASVANLKTASPTSFQASGRYALTLYCISPTPDGLTYPSAVYVTEIDYTAGAAGALGTWTVVTPGAAIAGEEFFSPDVLLSLDSESGGSDRPEGDAGDAAATGAAPATSSPAPGDAGASGSPSESGAPSAAGTASADNATGLNAAQVQTEVEDDANTGAGGLVVLIVLALLLMGGGAWLVTRRRRDNARIDALGERSRVDDDDEALVNDR